MAAKESGKAAKLTPKQAAFGERLMMEKIQALIRASMHVGLIAPAKSLQPSEKELADRMERYGDQYVPLALAVLIDESASPVNRAAAGMLLECFFPDWRDRASPEIVGRVVRRGDKEVMEWRTRVLDRDGHKCTQCGADDQLHVHHVVRWADEPSLRIIDSNGVTLCKTCHESVHAKT